MSVDHIADAIVELSRTDAGAAIEKATEFTDALLALTPARQGAGLFSLTKRLRKARAFDVLEGVCETVEAAGIWWGWPMSHHAQALIERGASLPAIGLLQKAREAAQDERDSKLFADAWALEGRAYKDLFVTGVRRFPRPAPTVLETFARRAEAAYGKAYRQLAGTPEAHYPAINMLAMGRLAEREGFALEPLDPLIGLAEGVVAEVSGRRSSDPGNLHAWDIASAAEAAAYLGHWEEARDRVRDYIVAAGDDAFALAGTLRQFDLLYGGMTKVPQVVEVLDHLKLALMKAEGGSVQLTHKQTARLVRAPSGGMSIGDDGEPEQSTDVEAVHERVADMDAMLEKVWGAEAGISHRKLQDVMQRARAVARVMMQTERSSRQTIGTGFLIRGELASDTLRGEVLFLTNAHVVCNDYRDAPARAGEAWASFDASPQLGDLELKNLLWSSPPDEHDVSIFKVRASGRRGQHVREVANLMALAKGLPHLHQQRDGKKVPIRVYDIGHRAGEDLSYSMRDNELIDFENVYGEAPGPEPRRIHYLAPKAPGSAGSPVFNARTLELIGIRHARGNLPRLNGAEGRYNVAEALWIRPLLTAFADTIVARPPEKSAERDGQQKRSADAGTRFTVALDFALKWRGGYSNHPADRGGATNRGITQATYDAWLEAQGEDVRSVKLLTEEEMHAIYRANYWQAARCDRFAPNIDWLMFDIAVNSGPRGAAKILQRALTASGAVVAVDGVIGPKTIAATKLVELIELGKEMIRERLALYDRIVAQRPDQSVFLQGWRNRTLDLSRAAELDDSDKVLEGLETTVIQPEDTGFAEFID